MGFPGEPTRHHSLRRIVNNPKVRELHQRIRRRPESATKPAASFLSPAATLALKQGATPLPTFVVALDSSSNSIEFDDGYPGASAGYLTSVAVVIRLSELTAAHASGTGIPPEKFRDLKSTQSTEAVLPGMGLLIDDCEDEAESFRRALYEMMAAQDPIGDGAESLLQTYEALVASRLNQTTDLRCPFDNGHSECGGQAQGFVLSAGSYTCSCAKKKRLHSTDWLRLSDGLHADSHSNAVNEAAEFIQKLTLLNVLRFMERTDALSSAANIAFVIDGPLSVPGLVASMKPLVEAELQRINAAVRKQTDSDLLIIGVEKSGRFVNHFARIEREHQKQHGCEFPRGSLLLPDNDYIRKNIIPGIKPFGESSSFGRRLLYRNLHAVNIVASVPYLRAGDDDIVRPAEPAQFPRLADVLNLLDEIWSRQYENGVMPLIVAHAEAAIPLHLGAKVFSKLLKEAGGNRVRP